MESELSYNTPIFNDDKKGYEYKQLSQRFLKNIGFTEQWNDSLDMYVYRLEDIIVYETLGAYKYNSTGTIINTLEDLQTEVIKEFGEPLELEY